MLRLRLTRPWMKYYLIQITLTKGEKDMTNGAFAGILNEVGVYEIDVLATVERIHFVMCNDVGKSKWQFVAQEYPTE